MGAVRETEPSQVLVIAPDGTRVKSVLFVIVRYNKFAVCIQMMINMEYNIH